MLDYLSSFGEPANPESEIGNLEFPTVSGEPMSFPTDNFNSGKYMSLPAETVIFIINRSYQPKLLSTFRHQYSYNSCKQRETGAFSRCARSKGD